MGQIIPRVRPTSPGTVPNRPLLITGRPCSASFFDSAPCSLPSHLSVPRLALGPWTIKWTGSQGRALLIDGCAASQGASSLPPHCWQLTRMTRRAAHPERRAFNSKGAALALLGEGGPSGEEKGRGSERNVSFCHMTEGLPPIQKMREVCLNAAPAHVHSTHVAFAAGAQLTAHTRLLFSAD